MKKINTIENIICKGSDNSFNLCEISGLGMVRCEYLRVGDSKCEKRKGYINPEVSLLLKNTGECVHEYLINTDPGLIVHNNWYDKCFKCTDYNKCSDFEERIIQ